MMFWENFYNLCVKNKTKPNPVAKNLGISSGTVTGWKNGAVPSSQSVEKIAKYFDVPTDCLINNEIGISAELTQKEKELLSAFRKLNESDQAKLLERAECLKESEKESQGIYI